MNQAVVPALGSWELKIDGGVRAVSAIAWDDATHLSLLSAAGAAPLVDVTLELLVEDPNLKSTLSKTVLPFGPEVIPAV